MSNDNDTSSGIDFGAVTQGPKPTDAAPAASHSVTTAEVDHPSVAALQAQFGDAIQRATVSAGDETVVYVAKERNRDILDWLRTDADQHYNHLADVTAVDYGGGRPLEVVYQLWSIPHRRALRVKCELPLSDLSVESVTPLWAGANWLEREVLDLFGIEFVGHPDPRRIMMPDNYAEGHPLRKDFPLRGRFSRAEQTRRALSQDPSDYYPPGHMGDRTPQTMLEEGEEGTNA